MSRSDAGNMEDFKGRGRGRVNSRRGELAKRASLCCSVATVGAGREQAESGRAGPETCPVLSLEDRRLGDPESTPAAAGAGHVRRRRRELGGESLFLPGGSLPA